MSFCQLMTCLLLTLSLFCGFAVEANQSEVHAVSFSVTDRRDVITTDIDSELLLRVYRSGLGWDVQVVRKPYDKLASSNLLYHSPEWHGPYPSQVYAWHVADKYFPNERELETRGYPYEFRIILENPVVEKTGADVTFVSGTIRIIWHRK